MKFLILITVICHINHLSTESLSSKSWSNLIQDLTLKHKENAISETNPINEGFMMIREQSKKPLPCNSSSPACKTSIRIPTTTVKSSTVLIDHSVGHLGRRVLNEPSYDTDDDMLLSDDEIKDLSKQLYNLEIRMDGSGETTDETTEQPTPTTTTTTIIPTRLTPVYIGILAGIAGLAAAITAVAVMAGLFGPSAPTPPSAPTQRLWHLPRAQMPTDGMSSNPNNPSNPSNETEPSIDSSFFNDLDDNLPSTNPADPNYDPIHELDSIIGNEDVETAFHDPLNEPDGSNEFFNPNLQMP